MKTIIGRLRELEDRLGPQIATGDGWSAKEELLKRLRHLAARLRGRGSVPESGPLAEAARQRVEDYLRSLREGTE